MATIQSLFRGMAQAITERVNQTNFTRYTVGIQDLIGLERYAVTVQSCSNGKQISFVLYSKYKRRVRARRQNYFYPLPFVNFFVMKSRNVVFKFMSFESGSFSYYNLQNINAKEGTSPFVCKPPSESNNLQFSVKLILRQSIHHFILIEFIVSHFTFVDVRHQQRVSVSLPFCQTDVHPQHAQRVSCYAGTGEGGLGDDGQLVEQYFLAILAIILSIIQTILKFN